MKRKILLLLVMTSFIITTKAQKKEKAPTTGYAITAAEKGGRNWKEVRLVNINTGEIVNSVYQSSQETEPLNARTQKPIVKKDATQANFTARTLAVEPKKGVVNIDDELAKAQGEKVPMKRVILIQQPVQTDKPFATNSAAMAYDKKHERLYYTPMGIAQLRYIDLKSNKIYYFEDEPFGVVKSFGDAPNQITRMVIASDGNGYALSNDANHLVRFTTGKNPVITDLGAVSDDGANEKFSVHSSSGFGGDMIADASGNLYLVQANRNVFKVSINSKVASYVGTIKGLPRGFSTNGAMVEEGSKVIVASSESTDGYYRFDLTTMQAEKVSSEGAVFNASDLANGVLAFDKKKGKKNKDEEPATPPETTTTDEVAKLSPRNVELNNGIGVYPNPVTNRLINVSFVDQVPGRYQVQFLDISGKLISTNEVNIASKMQVATINLPEVAKGNYLLKVTNGTGPDKLSVTNKIVVQ